MRLDKGTDHEELHALVDSIIVLVIVLVIVLYHF